MNERIRKLAEQAGFETNGAIYTVGNYQNGHEYFWAEDFIEDELKKFAELIVKECCQFENSYGGDAGLVARSYSRKIKEHFGVE
jgi:glutamate dehydrogenase/leucine dehydrogenase